MAPKNKKDSDSSSSSSEHNSEVENIDYDDKILQSEDINAFDDESVLKSVIDEKYIIDILFPNEENCSTLCKEDIKLYYSEESNKIVRYLEEETIPSSSHELITCTLLTKYLALLKELAVFLSELNIIDPMNNSIRNAAMIIKRFWDKYETKLNKFIFNKVPEKFEFCNDFCLWRSQLNKDISFDLEIMNKFSLDENGLVLPEFLKVYCASIDVISDRKDEYLKLTNQNEQCDQEIDMLLKIYKENQIEVCPETEKDNILFQFEVEKGLERISNIEQENIVADETINSLETKRNELLKQISKNEDILNLKYKEIEQLKESFISQKEKYILKVKEIVKYLSKNKQKERKRSSNKSDEENSD